MTKKITTKMFIAHLQLSIHTESCSHQKRAMFLAFFYGLKLLLRAVQNMLMQTNVTS